MDAEKRLRYFESEDVARAGREAVRASVSFREREWSIRQEWIVFLLPNIRRKKCLSDAPLGVFFVKRGTVASRRPRAR